MCVCPCVRPSVCMNIICGNLWAPFCLFLHRWWVERDSSSTLCLVAIGAGVAEKRACKAWVRNRILTSFWLRRMLARCRVVGCLRDTT